MTAHGLAHVCFWPKQTLSFAPHMSAFGGKADMTLCGNPLSRSLLVVKRTCLFALHMSAFDPKRTWLTQNHPFQGASFSRYDDQS